MESLHFCGSRVASGLQIEFLPFPGKRRQVVASVKKELKKADILASQRLSNTEENKILLETFFGRCSANQSSQEHESLDGVFRVVVVPRHAVVFQEREQLMAILEEPSLIIPSQLR